MMDSPSRRSEGRGATQAASGERALDEIIPSLYAELRRLAHSYLRRERPGQTLQTTAVVHEAYLRLACSKSLPSLDRIQLLAAAATTMRRILVDFARRRRAVRRGGEAQRIDLADIAIADVRGGADPIDLLSLDEALGRLSTLDPQQGRVVELRYFAGLTVQETASALGISPATVKREWTLAKAWLSRELVGGR